MEIEKMSVIEIKALIYDKSQELANLQQMLRELHEIVKLRVIKEAEVKEEKKDAVS